MKGNVYEKSGYWYVVLNYKGRDGKPKNKWIKTGLKTRGNKKNAEALIPDLIEKYKSLEYSEEGEELFTEYAAEWLKSKRGMIKQSTWECYETNVRTHILPYFEPLGLTIKDITPKLVKRFYSSLLDEGANQNTGKILSNQTIHKVAVIFKAILEEAVALEDIPKNPAKNIQIPKRPDEDVFKGKFLTTEEAQTLIDAFNGHELEVLVYVVLIYGLRRSEAVGLRWSAVDFINNTIEINHTVVNVSTIIAADTTKTASSRRKYPLLPEIKEALIKVKQQQAENKKLFGNCYVDSDYVFTWQDGTPFRPDSVSRSFKRVLQAHGLPIIRFHDLRHTCASLLHDRGWDIADAKEWLGHADIETTANIYTHISEQRKQKTAESLSGLFTLGGNGKL